MIDRADAIWEIPDRRAEALVAYESFLTAYPLSPLLPQALSMAALGQLEMKKPELAIERADTFLKQFASDKLAVDVGRIRAEAFFAKGDFQGAVTAYASLSAAHPAAPQRSTWMLRQAAALVTFKQWKEAHEVLVQAIPGLTGDDVGEAMLLDASSLLMDAQTSSGAGDIQAVEGSARGSCTSDSRSYRRRCWRGHAAGCFKPPRVRKAKRSCFAG